MISQILGYDSETALIRPGVNAPEMVCLQSQLARSAEDRDESILWHARLDDKRLYIQVREWLETRGLLIVGHELGFDSIVTAAKWPDLLPLLFDKYDRDEMTDTKYRMQLIDIAAGEHKGKRGWAYSLDDCIWQARGKRLDKGMDSWRYRYWQLRDTPLEEWPEAASSYALEDPRATLDVYFFQEKLNQKDGIDYLADQYRQARAYFALKLSSAWGIRTDADAVDKFEELTRREYENLKDQLIEVGLVRAKKGSKDTKAAKALMKQVCEELGVDPVLSDGGDISLSKEAIDKVAPEESIEEVEGQRTLKMYGDYQSLAKTISNDIPMLRAATIHPAHPNYGLAESGRSTCSSPNIQAIRRAVGIRECFRPRRGKVFAQADYEGLELRTMAQACIDLGLESKLAEALRAGIDVHLQIAAVILGITYEEAKKRKGDPDVKKARGGAKPANFGFIDGIGTESYRDYAKNNYGVIVDDPYAVKAAWTAAWTEMPDFFAGIKAILNDGGLIEQLRVGRWRRSDMFTKLCSTIHQGLGADAAKEAVWRVTKACYDPRANDILYGSRMVAFVHDEILLEVDEDYYAHDKAQRLGEIMKEGARVYLPDLADAVTLEPQLMAVWSKNAVPVYGPDGRLIPWRPEMKAA